MIEENDWRLLHHNTSHLEMAEVNPTDGAEIHQNAPHLKRCIFCLEPVQNSAHQYWYLPTDLSCCICEACFGDFKTLFRWRQLDGYDLDWGAPL